MAEFTDQVKAWTDVIEGPYSNHPKDPGGPTNHGITIKVLSAERGRAVSVDEVRALSLDEAVSIWKRNYWDVAMCDRLPAGLDYAMFDYALNSGPKKAVKDLQRALGPLYTGALDGVMGALTLDAVRKVNNLPGLIETLCELRFAFIKSLKTFSTFGRGWTRRIMGDKMGAQPGDDYGVIDRAVMLANGRENIPMPTTPSPHKADPQPDTMGDIIKKPETIGIVAGPLATILAALADNPVLSWTLAVIALGAAGLAAYVFIRRMKAADPT